MTRPSNEVIQAINLSHKAAKERTDCNIEPFVYEVNESYPGFILVDVQYSSKGFRALYEYRIRDGNLSLAQD